MAAGDARYRFLARFGSVILSGGIAAVPRALYYYQAELGLLPQEAWFVGYILAHRWTADLPYPSLRKMARRTGVTYQMLHRYKNSLIAKRYLTIIPRTRANGGRTTNSYDFSGLFQAIEARLLRDRGIMDEALEDTGTEIDDERTPGQPHAIGAGQLRLPPPAPRRLTGPGQSSSAGPDRPRTTAPDPPQTPTRRDPVNKISTKKTNGPEQTTTRAGARLTADATADSQAWAALLDLYAAANGRPATPLQVTVLHEIAADIATVHGADVSLGWIAAAIREAAEAGSGYLSPRRIRRICDRWRAEGQSEAIEPQSSRAVRTDNEVSAPDCAPLPATTWAAARDRLAESLSPANFRAFVADSRPIGVAGDRIWLGVPDALTADRLGGPFRSLVEAAFSAAIGRRVWVDCRIVRPERSLEGPADAGSATSWDGAPRPRGGRKERDG